MWQVNLGTSILYFPGSEDATIYDTNLNQECGLAGEFTFKVPPTNPLYSSLVNGALITVLKDKEEFWRGEIRDIKTDFAKIAEVYCSEDMAWLGDEFLEPALITNETYAQRLQAAITAYNTDRSAERQFTAGYVNNRTSTDTCTWKTGFEDSILDNIRKCICGDNGYVRVRRVTSNGTVTRYIDVVSLENYGISATQPIEYGYNLLDYVKESDYGNLTNVLTPFGAELETEKYSGLQNRLKGTVISNADSIAVYGRHAKARVFDGVTDLTTLNNLASAYLSRYSQPQLTLQVKAVDLSVIGEADEINIGDSVRVVAKPFAVDRRFYLTQIQRDIQNIEKNSITMSDHVTRRTLTSQVTEVMETLDKMPDEVLSSARQNALNMLLDETQGGYVVYEYDANNKYIVAINVCDALTIENSKKRWRWSQNGIGYMYRSQTVDEHGQQVAWEGPNVAMTIDGSVVATMIKAGILTDLNGKFSLNMETGAINMQDGTFGGTVNATGGYFKSGYFGSNGNWEITTQGLHTKNGPTAPNGQTTKGVYVGADGICCNGDSKHVWISDGAMTTNGGLYAKGITEGGDGLILNGNVSVNKSGSSYTGASGVISWATSQGGFALNIQNGIVVSIVKP